MVVPDVDAEGIVTSAVRAACAAYPSLLVLVLGTLTCLCWARRGAAAPVKSASPKARMSEARQEPCRDEPCRDAAGHEKPAAALRQTASWGSWLSCCAQRSWLEETCSRPAHGPGRPVCRERPLTRSRSLLPGVHPKFCGLRLAQASEADELPSCDGFSPKPAYGDSLPGAWEDLLRYAPGEAGLCAELRSAVASVPGPKDSITLLRYLRARQGKVEKAADMYTASMRWRRETGWDDGFRKNTIDDSLHKRLDDYWKPLGLLGFDREGDPLLWEQMGTCHMASLAKLSVDVVERHEAYSLTRIVQALEDLSVRRGRPFMYFTVVEVLEGIGPQHFNRKGLQTYQKVVRIGEDYYPEMMKRAILIHAPWIFEKLWMVVSRFFDEGTRNKMQIVGPARSYDVLTKYISPEWIPEKWGGHLHVCSNSSCSPILVPSAPVPEALIEAINASPSSY